MSAQAIGILEVLIAKENIEEFETYFDQTNSKSFPNAEISFHNGNIEKIGECEYSRRLYDFNCSYSIYGCLLECKEELGFDFQDICKKLGVREATIDAYQPEDKFSEQIFLSSEGFKYEYDYENSEVELD